MTTLGTTTMSSKGQVVIPEAIRQQLGLQTGAQFIVVGDRDAVVLKPINTPSMEEFEHLIVTAREEAKRAGMKRSDIQSAIRTVRNRTVKKE
jgi:AbrB family looped-hinge helix DNA binding protein